MFYIQLNLGRNVNGTPMSDERWTLFRGDAADLLNLVAQQLGARFDVEEHYGRGEYEGDHEESCHLSILVDVEVTPGQQAFVMNYFNQDIKHLARDYDQDSIALVTGSKLIKAAVIPV